MLVILSLLLRIEYHLPDRIRGCSTCAITVMTGMLLGFRNMFRDCYAVGEYVAVDRKKVEFGVAGESERS